MEAGNKGNASFTPDPNHLKKLANYKMPFGKYKGQLLVNIPEPYYVWFYQKGFPKGTLGSLLQEMYEIKLNGLEGLIRPFIERAP
ncbi:MAG TPA: hypothetical protein DEA82_00895 [Flavobacteriaceae bacterium]|jgi:uncharacterized protein (DUF3820 family)|nr:hypothetical protein [Flavobacteriaceae bacterium]|tara:strand:+ start:428 stop:682 length:255 start_codon:yes stop_codon:yes gene_type:complete